MPSRPAVLFALGFALCAASGPVALADPAGVSNSNRAHMNYMLNCQGCHGPQGQGSEVADVPRMKEFVGHFLSVPGGREYLVQVPGSANASVNDAELAELLNWMLPHVSASQLPDSFTPYTEAEIKALRYSPEEDVAGTREKLVRAIEGLQSAH